MYSLLLEEISYVPKAYESSGLAFWDDDHISKGMLENHLSPDSDGATREYSQVQASVGWLDSLLAPQGKILDLGCGPGIYAELLAKKGHQVTGVDVSSRSIAYAKNSASTQDLDIEYHCKSYLKVELPESAFDMAILIYCDYGVLSPCDREALLKKTFNSLKPGGLFVVDVFSPAHYQDYAEGFGAEYAQSGFWSEKPHAVISKQKIYPDHHYLERYLVITEKEYRSYNIWNHAFSALELAGELEAVGFEEVKLYADACGRDYNEKSKTLCAVAVK